MSLLDAAGNPVLPEPIAAPEPTPEPPDPFPGWELGHRIGREKVLATLGIASKFAKGKPLTWATMMSIRDELPEGVMPSDALEIVKWGISQTRAEREHIQQMRAQKNFELRAALTIKTRMKIAAKALIKPRAKNNNRARMAKLSRRQNRR